MSNAKIRFHCRRGMAEVEERLLEFFQADYERLSQELQEQFSVLLECEDTELWDWLITYQAEPPANLVVIVDKIRHYVAT